MITLVVGAKGGLGTSTLARHLTRASKNGIGLDLHDGQLAIGLGRKTWPLYSLVAGTASEQRQVVDWVVARTPTLLWTPDCAIQVPAVWQALARLSDRALVVADGGIDPPPGVDRLADVIVIVSADTPVAKYHAGRLRARYPAAAVVTLDLAQSRHETRDAARELATQLDVCR